MRRSVRDAIVGFTVLGGLVGFAATGLWMRGIRLGSSDWRLTANFNDASGLAERSPVTYRGILVGSVRSIKVTSSAVIAELEITKGDLRLPLPVTATIGSGSLLGGDAQVALMSLGNPLPQNAPLPNAGNCQAKVQLCDGAKVLGREAPSIATVTDAFQELLMQAKVEKLIPNAAASIEQINATAKSFEDLTVQLQAELVKVDPVLRNLQAATAHANNIVASLDNPETLSSLRQTASNAAELIAKFDAVGDNFETLTSDQAFMDGLRSVTIGLGALFSEVYPAKTSP
jgi:phospholipid/cholesterol/gamma-HCH transport system substrate-binding protein